MKCRHILAAGAASICAGLLFCEPAMAYVGPGAGLSAIGAFLAVIAAVIAALLGFIWYPVKRLAQKLRGAKKKRGGGSVQ